MNEELLNKLKAPLDHTRVKQFGSNAGAKKGLSFLEGHDVIRELNEVFNFDWSHTVKELKYVGMRSYESRGKQMVQPYYTCIVEIIANDAASLHVPFRIVHQGVGGGSASMPDYNIAEAHEFAAKEAETDALKRAATKFGDRFGLALYDKAQENVTKPYDPNRAAANLQAEVIGVHKMDPKASVEHIKQAIQSIVGELVPFIKLDQEQAEAVAKAAISQSSFTKE